MAKARSRRRAYMRHYMRALRQARHFGVPVSALWRSQHVHLACCGQWQPVTTLPHVCPSCGQRYLEGEGRRG